jgi:type IV pilus assembly protein PilM
MLKLFSANNLNYLGIDIGSAGIKVVELKNENGRPRLITYGFCEETFDIAHSNQPEMRAKIVNTLIKILMQARVTTKKTIAALPSFSVFSSIISLPEMNKKDLEQAIYWQAKKFLPLPIEETTIDWKLVADEIKFTNLEKTAKPLNNNETNPLEQMKELGQKKNTKVLVAAASKKLVMRYVEIFQQAGLELLSLETETFALARSLIGANNNPIMLVDIGAITSDISVIENGVPLLSRSVDSGGEIITQAIVNSLHIDRKRAEQFKRDIGFSSDQGNLPRVIETAITPIINEIKYCFDLYASQQTKQNIEKIVLTGGSSFLPKLDEYLAKLLNVKVMIGDPWNKVIYPLELKTVLDDIAPRFGVAVGLAMREIV